MNFNSESNFFNWDPNGRDKNIATQAFLGFSCMIILQQQQKITNLLQILLNKQVQIPQQDSYLLQILMNKQDTNPSQILLNKQMQIPQQDTNQLLNKQEEEEEEAYLQIQPGQVINFFAP